MPLQSPPNLAVWAVAPIGGLLPAAAPRLPQPTRLEAAVSAAQARSTQGVDVHRVLRPVRSGACEMASDHRVVKGFAVPTGSLTRGGETR